MTKTHLDKCLERVAYFLRRENCKALQPEGLSRGSGQGLEKDSRDYRVARNSGGYGRVQ